MVLKKKQDLETAKVILRLFEEQQSVTVHYSQESKDFNDGLRLQKQAEVKMATANYESSLKNLKEQIMRERGVPVLFEKLINDFHL